MSKKNGGTALDDRSLEPYKVPPKKDIKANKSNSTEKKGKTGKKNGKKENGGAEGG